MSALEMVEAEPYTGPERRSCRQHAPLSPVRGGRNPKSIVFRLTAPLRKHLILRQVEQQCAIEQAQKFLLEAQRCLAEAKRQSYATAGTLERLEEQT